MHILNGKRIWIDRPVVIDEITYPHLHDEQLRAELGIVEVADPSPPADYTEDKYTKTEQDTEPYVVYAKTPKAHRLKAAAATYKEDMEGLQKQYLSALLDKDTEGAADVEAESDIRKANYLKELKSIRES